MQRVDEGPISADVSRYVEGVQFPALKHDVVHAFRRNGASDIVVARIHNVPVTEFADLDHLKRAYDEAHNLEQPDPRKEV
jgi:hypothetical protein